MKIYKTLLLKVAVLFCTTVAGQVRVDTLNQSIWLQSLINNKIQSKSNGSFKNAPFGFALYTSSAGSIQVPYWVYVPKSYRPDKSTSLIIFLHGGVMGRDSFDYKNYALTKEPIFALADIYGYLVLYPFAKRDFGWVKQEEAFERVIDETNNVKQFYNIDKKNVFLGGMSDGGAATFWYISNKPKLFKSFFALSAYPKIYKQAIKFENITKSKPLFSINAKDDELILFGKATSIYDQHKNEAKGWQFDSVAAGGHGFIYGDEGIQIMNHLLGKLFDKTQLNMAQKLRFDLNTQTLDSIAIKDQLYRSQMESVRKKYGGNSEEMRQLFKKLNKTDSLNLIVVNDIIGKFGWLDPKLVGSEKTHTLFMVIQHADLKTQEKYMPLLRTAAINGMLSPSSLALLEDRVALKEGKKQIYGSQISWDLKTNKYTILPLQDPDNVDKRRSQVGLGPLADYVKDCCNLTWNVEQYKKEQTSTQ